MPLLKMIEFCFSKIWEENFDHQNIYKNYLETRTYVYEEINRLYKTNKECPIAGDQEIGDEKVLEAKKELSEFLNNY